MMTNTFFHKAAALLAGVSLLTAVVSCVKEKDGDRVHSEGVYLHADIQQVEPEVKTTLVDAAHVYWTANSDVIRVYNPDLSASVTGTAQSSAASTDFLLEGALSGGSFCAVYPASATSPDDVDFEASASAPSSGYAVKTRHIVFSTQRALANGFDPASMPMVAIKGADGSFTFVNYASLLQFTLSGNGIAKVVVEGNTGAAVLAGSFYVQAKDDDADGVLDTFTVAEDASPVDSGTSVTLLPPSGSSTFPAGTYYVAVRPNVTVTGGLRVTSYDASGNPLKTLGGIANVTLNRGKIRPLGSLAAGSDLERIQACSMVKSASQTSTRILATGIQETDYEVTWNVNGSLPEVTSLMHVVRFDRQKATDAGAKIRTLTAYDGNGVEYDGADNQVRQSVRNMMICAGTRDETVIFGTSASEHTSGQPKGLLKKDGVVLYETYTNTYPMVAVRGNNNMYIGQYSNYGSWTDANRATYQNINGGRYIGVLDRELQDIHNTTRYGITAEGYTVRGNNTTNGDIYFVVVDNNGDNTKGATFKEVAAVLQSLGCYRAAFGQSASAAAMWARNPQTHVMEPLGEGAFDGEPISAWGITIPRETYASVSEAIAKCPVVKAVNSSSTTTIKTGCTYTAMNLTMAQGYTEPSNSWDLGDKLNLWVLKVDPVASGLNLKVLMKNDSYTAGATSFPTASLTAMAQSHKTNTGKQPRVIFNGDFFDTDNNNRPMGPVHARGTAVKTTWQTDLQQGQAFIGIKSDKTVVIGDRADYSSNTSTYPELIGAGLMFLKDGKFNSSYVAADGHWAGGSNTYIGNSTWPGVTRPRTAVGYDSTNKIVYVIWADGRNAGTTKGACYVELCELFRSLGCDRAVNLDGGQSTQFVKWNSGTSYSRLNDPRNDDKPVGTQNARNMPVGLAFVED
ncbi:MAG: phosphodiester glycosidase family protein [Bacteroidales bacterium]|nr:phosphodiester glycosidase family protein [Bacteroidales bacterium]